MKRCPFCEGEISNTAKKCKHCGEWVTEKEKNSENQENKKSDKEITKNNVEKTNNDGFNGLTLRKFISDNLVLVVVGTIIVFCIVKSLLKHESDQGNNVEYDINESVEISEDIESNTKYNIKPKNFSSIKPTDYGYKLFQNTIGECEIRGEKEISKFIESVKATEDGEIIKVNRGEKDESDWECPRSYGNESLDNTDGKDIAILFDNTYSLNQNGDIDKSGPNQRMSSLKSYFNEDYLPNGSIIDIAYMFTIIPNDNSEEPHDNLYRFKINPSAFSIKYIKDKGGDNIKYLDGRYFLNFENTSISYTFSGISKNDIKCINDVIGSSEYTCYDVENVYKKIQDIYLEEYDKEYKHTNNMLIKTLSMNKDLFSGISKKDEILIFTNGEFKIGYEHEEKYLTKLKRKYKTQWGHDQGADKTHNLAEFNMRYTNRYQKDNKYESFWTEAINALRPEIPACEGVKISVIGLTRSAEFKPLAEKIYTQIFSPCEVSFQ